MIDTQVRDRLPKKGAGKSGQSLRKSAISYERMGSFSATRLKALAKRLDDEQLYAIRALAANVSPTRRAKVHAELAADTTDHLERYAQMTHAELNAGAAKYLTTLGGKVALRDDAPSVLRRAWEQYEKVVGSRERIYRDLDVLADETMRNRVDAVARFFADEELARNPGRQQLELVMRTIAPDHADDFMLIVDQQALRHLDDAMAGGSQLGPDAAADAYFREMDRVVDTFPQELKDAYREVYGQGLRFGDDVATSQPAYAGSAGSAGGYGLGQLAEQLARRVDGYDEAVAALERGELPREYLERLIADSSLSEYEKLSVGQHLDALAGGALRDVADRVPGLGSYVNTPIVKGRPHGAAPGEPRMARRPVPASRY